jgi:hypothetical protein
MRYTLVPIGGFQDALQVMREGHYVRREDWAPSYRITLERAQRRLYFVNHTGATKYLGAQDCVSTDWQLVVFNEKEKKDE